MAKVLDAQVLNGVEDASISHITGTMVYNLVANGRQALEAAYRVIEPEGVIGLTLGASAEWMELVRTYNQFLILFRFIIPLILLYPLCCSWLS